jgi:hypothetical protein
MMRVLSCVVIVSAAITMWTRAALNRPEQLSAIAAEYAHAPNRGAPGGHAVVARMVR